jgi:polyisoprenoid-binding protein YceI
MTTATAAAVATSWTVDPSHSHAEFAVRHLMISTVKGRFAEVTGTLTGDDADPENASIELTIPVAGIDTREDQRDAHLRSADFFDAEHHPAITFRSSKIAIAGLGFSVTGDLTIRGITRSVTLQVETGGRVRDPWGNERLAVQRHDQAEPQGFRAALEPGPRNRRRPGWRRGEGDG